MVMLKETQIQNLIPIQSQKTGKQRLPPEVIFTNSWLLLLINKADEVNLPIGKNLSTIFQILAPTESICGELGVSSIFIKSRNSKAFNTFSLVILPDRFRLKLAPSSSSIKDRCVGLIVNQLLI